MGLYGGMTVKPLRWSARVLTLVMLLAAFGLLLPATALGESPDLYEPDDIPAVDVPTLLVDVASAQEHTLTGYDMDWVRIDVQAGVHYEFTVMSKPALPSANVRMMLWPAEVAAGETCSAIVWATTPEGSSTTTLMYTPTSTTTLYLSVEGYDFGSSCSYWLAAYTGAGWTPDTYELDDLNPALGPVIDCGLPPVARELSPGDVDWFTVWAIEPGEYGIWTDFSACGPPPDTMLEVFDSTGTTLLASNDDGSNGGPLSRAEQLVVTEPTAWRVRVTSAKGQPYGPYTLAAGQTPPTLGTISGTVTGPDGEPLDMVSVTVLDPNFNELASCLTDADGAYTIDRFPYGVPFRVAADLPGLGLVSALCPEVRDLVDPSTGPTIELGPDSPEGRFNLQIRRPWVSGYLTTSPGYAQLAAMTITVYDEGGFVVGTGTTSTPYGAFFIELPPHTGSCKIAASDPAGIRATTWYWNYPDEASAPFVSIPTYGGIGFSMPLAATVRCEQTDSQISYNGTWTTYSGVGSSVSGSFSDSSGASMEVSFDGTRLDWVTLTGPYYGIASVSIDGGPAEEVDLYSSSFRGQQTVWSTHGLPPGRHTVRFARTGRKNAAALAGRLSTDVFVVAGALAPAPVLTRYEQTAGAVEYDGLWNTYSGCGSSVTGAWSDSANARVRVAFTGTRLDWVTLTGPYYGIASVRVDGGESQSVDLYSAQLLGQQAIWSTGDLAEGYHTLEIRGTGLKNPAALATRISTDVFAVQGTLETPPVVTRYEQTDPRVNLEGSWTTYAGSGCSVSGAFSDASDAAFEVLFSGTRLDWMTLTGPLYGIAEVSIDGGTPVEVDLYSPAFRGQQLVWTTGTIPEGVHAVRFTRTGRKNAASAGTRISADVLEVTGSLLP